MAEALMADDRRGRSIDLSVVIVSYHCRDLILACARSLLDPRPLRRIEVIVVDNGSTDGTVEALAALAPAVRVVALGTNVGFSKANNVGIGQALGRQVLILNPDTRVEAGALDRLADWLDVHPSAGVAAPRLLNPDGTDQRTARSFPTPTAGLFGRRSPMTRWFPNNRWSYRFLATGDPSGDEPFRVDWVSGAAMMVPASVIAAIGAFDEAFFLFWEDADWCKRIGEAGLDVWCIPQARVIHDEGGTRGHAWSPRTTACFHRGAYLYWRKHHTPEPWNPARWVGAGALILRAAILMVIAVGRGIPARRNCRPICSSNHSTPIPELSR